MKVKIIKDHWNYKKGETVEVSEGRAVYLKKVHVIEEVIQSNKYELDENHVMITNDAGKPLEQAESPKKVIKVKQAI